MTKAQAIEARRAATTKIDAVHESAVPARNAPGHRTYLQPNHRLLDHRSTVWQPAKRKGHRMWSGKQEWRR
jgi:hypothetical protein